MNCKCGHDLCECQALTDKEKPYIKCSQCKEKIQPIVATVQGQERRACPRCGYIFFEPLDNCTQDFMEEKAS